MAQITSLSLMGTPGQPYPLVSAEASAPWFVEAIQIGSPVEAIQIASGIEELES